MLVVCNLSTIEPSTSSDTGPPLLMTSRASNVAYGISIYYGESVSTLLWCLCWKQNGTWHSCWCRNWDTTTTTTTTTTTMQGFIDVKPYPNNQSIIDTAVEDPAVAVIAAADAAYDATYASITITISTTRRIVSGTFNSTQPINQSVQLFRPCQTVRSLADYRGKQKSPFDIALCNLPRLCARLSTVCYRSRLRTSSQSVCSCTDSLGQTYPIADSSSSWPFCCWCRIPL